MPDAYISFAYPLLQPGGIRELSIEIHKHLVSFSSPLVKQRLCFMSGGSFFFCVIVCVLSEIVYIVSYCIGLIQCQGGLLIFSNFELFNLVLKSWSHLFPYVCMYNTFVQCPPSLYVSLSVRMYVVFVRCPPSLHFSLSVCMYGVSPESVKENNSSCKTEGGEAPS